MSRLFLPFALALLAAPVAAQTLDADAAPRQGTLQVGSSATDALDLTLDPTTRHPDAECPGYLTPGAPDAVVEWSGASPLRLWVRSAADATMTVIGPDGNTQCIDDADGVQPALLLEQPTAGRYAVWVGTFSSSVDTDPAATLYAGPPPPPLSPGDAASAPALSFSGDEDASMEVTPGGMHPAEALGMPPYCTGFYSAEPSARASGPTPYTITASSGSDLTLAVRTRGGGWLCNDDGGAFGSTDPAVEVQGEGEQTVWVGTFRGYARGNAPEGTLTLTAEAPSPAPPAPPPPAPPAPRTYFYEAEYVSLDLDARGLELALGANDEMTDAVLTLGMGIGNPLSGMSCNGYLTAAPTLTLTAEGGGPVTLLASGEDDLVMVARDAEGQWFCSDDASGRDPAIEVDALGEVTVWIGTYGQLDSAGAVFTATRGEIADVLPEPLDEFSPGPFEEVGRSYAEGSYSGSLLGGDAQTALSLSEGEAEGQVFAGGEESNPVEGLGCTGFLSAEPSATVESGAATLAFTASPAIVEGADLTMVVQTPDGRWFCSDDHEGTDPGIEVSGGGDGVYTIWVGTFRALDTPVESVLRVREGALDGAE
ncbi:MAG TPA: hypothetical protein EYQ24_04330 [Bacteroidetes bacterium]|nr:hypothetical protein [Bacteroidota bacterium]